MILTFITVVAALGLIAFITIALGLFVVAVVRVLRRKSSARR